MRKLISLTLGLAMGGFVGTALVMLFAPMSGQEFVERIKQHYADALEAGRKAAEERRAELEAELRQMQNG